MQQMIDEKKSQANDFDAQIAKAKQEAAAYKALIKQQNSELARLDEEENAIIKAEEFISDCAGSTQRAYVYSTGRVW